MTPDACRDWRSSLAAFALGRVDEAEEVALRAHLDGCAACRAELDELTAVARALPLADPGRVSEDAGEPPSRLGARVVDRVTLERTRSHRRRTWRVFAAAAALVVGVGVGAVVVTRRDNPAPATTVTFPATAEAVGTAELMAQEEGTEVRLVASGLDEGDWYWLWLTGDDGDRVTAGTFKGTGGEVDVTLTAALSLDDARRIWVTDDAEAVVLDAEL
jgi:hypothetical protein